MFSKPRNGKENVFGLLGGPGACMHSRKIFEIKIPRLAKNAFPREFSFEKLDKNMSTRSLVLKFERLKHCLLALGEGGNSP